jgi:uncharacterized membrane protein (DUF373 family)
MVQQPREANEGTAARFKRGYARWKLLPLYERFEQVVILILTAAIAVIVVLAVWNLLVKIVLSIILSQSYDPTDYGVFQALFGMIFTVIIALEFKRSLLVVAERRQNIVQVRAVILLALLAVVRKLIILDLKETDALQLLGLSAAILALGAVYWLVRSQEHPEKA